MTRKLGCLLLLLLTGGPAFAAGVGMISGYVTDSTGAPRMGAVVDIVTSAATLGTTVFTDANGHYAAANLAPGKYQIKVRAASFLPSLRENVRVNAGAHVLVNLTLSTLADALKLLPPRRTVATDPDDW
ncbi:MAG: carboxypeptidase-like regulatory domain-containing protein, partial [Candidatus Angelobacter sp.]